jgi:hypothetical protein
MLLAELDLKADAWLIAIGLLIQGGALTALGILWRHHIKTISSHKSEIKEKDKVNAALIVAKDNEIKVREEACREELADCQRQMHDDQKEFRAKTEEILKDALRHEAELLNDIRAELRSGS